MRVPRFELDRWMQSYQDNPPKHSLAGSTGPVWTVQQILELDGTEHGPLLDMPTRYSPVEGSDDLRHAVGNYTCASIDDVQITTGASEALTILMAAHARRGANVVVPDPGYPPFAALAEIFGMNVKRYPLEHTAGFRLSPEGVKEQIDERTALVIVNTPHSPTGSSVRRDELFAIYEATRNVGATLVVDEVFNPITHGAELFSAVDLTEAVVVGDMSKALSLPGLRVGWIIDRNDERRAPYFDLRANFTLSNSPITEQLATIALNHSADVLARTQTVASANLKVLESVLKRHVESIDYVRPDSGMTMFPRLIGESDSRPFCHVLARAGLLAVPGDCFGHPEHVRFGFGALEPTEFRKAAAVLDGILSERPWI